MRYLIKIDGLWKPLFTLFGFSARRSYVEFENSNLHVRFGSNDVQIPFSEIVAIHEYQWPWYYGYGAKFGPNHGVAYIGSSDGVVRLDFVQPRPLVIWGPFRTSKARGLIVSLENHRAFIQEFEALKDKAKSTS